VARDAAERGAEGGEVRRPRRRAGRGERLERTPAAKERLARRAEVRRRARAEERVRARDDERRERL
jgi:hypothetical protein